MKATFSSRPHTSLTPCTSFRPSTVAHFTELKHRARAWRDTTYFDASALQRRPRFPTWRAFIAINEYIIGASRLVTNTTLSPPI